MSYLYHKLSFIAQGRNRNADFTRDVLLQDDGAGPYLKHWDEEKLGPRPTQEEIDAADGEKLAHNAGLDAQIQAVEAANPITHRASREGLYAQALLADMLNETIAQIEAQIRTIPGHEAFTIQRLPDLKKNAGMVRIKTADDAIRVLRAQRLP